MQFLGALEIGGKQRLGVCLGEYFGRHLGLRAFTGDSAAGLRAGIATGLGLATLVVEIRVEILLGQLTGHAGGGHLGLGHPHDGVQHGFAIIIVAPVEVIVPAGKTEAAAAIGALKGPGNMLEIAGRHALAHMRVAAVGPIPAPHGFGRGHIRQDRRHAFHVLGKPHVEIPFIIRLKGLYPAGNGVFGEFLEIGHPVRVHRPMCFKTAALPFDEFLVAFVGGGLHGVMDREKPHPLVHEFAKQSEVVASQRRMATTAVTVNDHGIGAIKHAGVRGKSVGDDGGRHEIGSPFLQTLGQQHDTGAVFMGERTVALRASNHHHLFGCGQSGDRQAQRQRECEDMFHRVIYS